MAPMVTRGGPAATARFLWMLLCVMAGLFIGQSLMWLGGRLSARGVFLIDRIKKYEDAL